MAKQSRLEKEGIEYRDETVVINDYINEAGKSYDENHEDAKTHDDENHPWGKGTSNGGHGYKVPDETKSKKIDYSQFNTTDGGGSFDKYGRNGVGGRRFLNNINLYNEDTAYGENSVDTTKNQVEGQYVVGGK